MGGTFTCEPLPEDIIKRISGVTFKPNDDIRLCDLSYLRLSYVNFDGNEQVGEMICSKKLANDVKDIFRELFEARYPIEKMRLADDYGGDDDKIMADNNTSCFNYRTIADTNTVSLHGMGRAVDINPLYNPYIVGEKVMPANAVRYADRTADFPHKIDHDDICFAIFAAHGWKWGGDWKNSKDYQHFYKPDGRIKRICAKIAKAVGR